MKRILALLALMALLATGAMAQDQGGGSTLVSPMDLAPASASMDGFRYEAQGWNNCGPATLTMGLTYFGYQPDQNTAAAWLKPNVEDKNVSPWQMAEFVNQHAPGTTRAIVRYGGELDLLKQLVANEFPVIIEAGYDPPPGDLGWMGHYLLIKGYDDSISTFITHDSYDGADYPYSYAHIEEFWWHFGNLYIVLYDIDREAELMDLLGTDADPQMNLQNTLTEVQTRLAQNPEDGHGYFNLGTMYTELGNYEYAVAAYDQARSIGLPWRMLWYQFGPFEAYLNMSRNGDVIQLAQANLNDGGGQYVEETFYYAALARENLGEIDRALQNLNTAIQFNPNFTPAIEARDRLLNS
jgi:tetratricopeptide (TPR) repeat protein